MRWSLVIALAVLAGCNSRFRYDPFLGPQTIPPPGTGTAGLILPKESASAPPSSEYYSDRGTGARPASGSQYLPKDGSLDYRGRTNTGGTTSPSGASFRPNNSSTNDEADDRTPRVGSVPLGSTSPDDKRPSRYERNYGDRYGAADDAEDEVAPPSARGSSDPGARRTSVPIPSRSSDPAGASRGIRRTSGESEVADLIELPEVRRDTGFRPVSTSRSSRTSGTRPAAKGATLSATPAAEEASHDEHEDNYGFDPQYRWLMGRLEYSLAQKQWKLRYIPVAGEMDRHGGSVVIADSQKLKGYRPGNLVRVDGRLISSGDEDGLAPEYRVDDIRAVR
jgi:hypothetical protein